MYLLLDFFVLHVMIRYHIMILLLSLSSLIVVESELAACLEGVTRALEASSEDMIIETDCLELVRLAKSGSKDYSSLGHWVDDLRSILNSPKILRVNKIHRDQNVVSHELARLGMLQDSTNVWLDSAPEFLLSRILRDCNDTII
jgi:hypothetical protein